MLVSSLAHCLSVLIFQLWGVQTLSPIPTCPVSCVCEETLLVNCASQSLPKAPSHIPATTTALDLSHNALHSLSPLGSGHMHLQGLQHLRVGNNSLESLSMCSGIQGIAGTRTLTRGKQRCVSWAPHLQSLSADRNQLKCLPRGLGNIKSLKVLQLSHNRISEIGRADLAGCAHLNELHLQYNLINTIHPEAFKDLQKLKVLDVSYNLLATIPVPAYLSLRNMNVLVDIFGNRWRCDCNLKTIRRWLSFDSELGKPAWEVVCFSPSHHVGKSLLYLEESDLACLEPVYSTPGLKKEVTVEEGMEFILSCSAANQDFMHTFWWTPQGQISDSQSFLHISNATERDAGLYVCISGYQEEHVSVFSLHVRKRAHDKRLRREAPIGSVELNSEDKDNIRRNVPSVRAVQQSHFALAVSLSVIITFIVAFVLGVVFRPFLDKCYKQIQNKRNSTPSPPNSPTSSTAQRPYVNEGYSDTDDQEQEVHEGPRVTFGGVTEIHEKGGVPYYVTLEGSRSGSNTDDTVLHKNTDRVLVENIELHKDVPRRKENKEMTSSISTESLNAESSKGMEFEYIPDPEDTIELEDKSISPASSISGEQQESQMPYEAKESTEQSVDSPTVSKYEEEEDDEQASTGQRTTIPGFVTDPFKLNMSESKEESVDELDPDLWNDSGESFSFTEGSPRSSSRVSNVDAFGHPDIQKEMSVDEPRDRSSSWNSSKGEESEGGDTEYTVNPEDDEDLETQISYSENDDMDYDENKLSILEEDIHNKNKKPGTGAQLRQDTITLDPTDIHLTYARGDSFDDEQFTDYKGRHPSSNSDYEDEPTPYHVHPVYRSSIQTTTPMEDVSGTSRCVEENAPKSPHQQESTSVIDRISESDESRASSYFDDSIFGKIDQAFDPIPQVKRYLHFTQSQSHPPIHTLPCSTEEEEIIPSEVEKTESKKFYSEDNFFAQSDASLAEAPKVKHYVQFSPSESQISSDSTPTASVKQVATPVVVSKREAPPDTISISYEGQSISLEAMPKAQRYVQFRQSEPQTVHEPKVPAIKEGSFFGQIPISFDEVPKVKHYVQFSPSESQISSDSTPKTSVSQVSTPVVVSKTESPPDTIHISYEGQSVSLPEMPKAQRYVQFRQSEPQTVNEPNITNIKEGSFFGQIPMSFDEVPKVKHYVQFSPSESQISSDSTSVSQVSTPVVVSKTESPSDTIHISYEGQSISLEAMPKVQRYVQFIKSEPQTVHEPNIPAIKEGSFFGQIPMSFDEVPEVKHYVQFSPSESQISSDSTPKTSVSQVATPVVVSKTESPPDTISISYEGQSVSLEAMTKVQRYVQFRQSEPQTVNEPKVPAIKEGSFFGQIPISFDEVPKVKHYVQFSPSESQISSDSTPKTSVSQVSTPVVVSKTESPPDTIHISYEGQSVSLPEMPKAQRYVQFRQSEPQTVNEPNITNIKEGSFFGQIPMSFDEVPKVKHYVQFSPSESQISSDSTSVSQVSTPVVVSKTESPSDTIHISYEGQSISLEAMPKVQRYVQFIKSEPQTVHEPNIPAIKEGSFFGQIPMSFDEVPEVKHYVQFSPSESQISSDSTPKTSVSQVATPVVVSKTESPPDTISISYEGQSVSLEAMTKVQRYVQFRQSEPQTVNEPKVPAIKEGSFFGQIPISFDEVPKVKHYVQFSPSESQISSDSTPKTSVSQVSTPVVVSKTESPPDTIHISYEGQSVSLPEMPKAQRYVQFRQSEPQTVNEPNITNIKEGSFFGQIPMSFDEVPKVKHYVQFSPSESQISSDSTSVSQVSTPVVVSKTESPPDTISISYEGQSISLEAMPKVQRYVQFIKSEPQTVNEPNIPAIKEGSFFGQIPMSFDEVPKVKHYVQFSPSESQISRDSTPTASVKQVATPVVVSKREAPPDTISISYEGQSVSLEAMTKVQRYVQFRQSEPQTVNEPNITNIHRGSFFGQIPISFDEVPNVKHYVQFSPSESQISSDSTPKTSVSQVSTPVVVSKTESPPDTIHISYEGQSVSLPEMPKVQRYVQFIKSEPQTVNEPNIPAIKEGSFFGQIPISFDEVPEVKQYVQFSPSESQISSDSTPTALFNQVATPVVVSKTESPSDTISISYEGQSVSLEAMTKVQRYVQFRQSEPQTVNEPNITNIHRGSFFGQIPISFAEVPNVKRRILFSQLESHYQPSPEYRPSKKRYPLSEEQNTHEIKTTLVTLVTKPPEDFFVQIGAFLDGMPKVKRYMQFTQSEVFKTYNLPYCPLNLAAPTLQAGTEVKKNNSPFEDGDPVVDEDSFFGQLGVFFDGIPKIRRRIQFTERLSQHPESQSPSNYIQPAAAERSFFVPIGASSEIPKVRRYIRFSQSSSQPSSQYYDRQTARPVLTKPELISSTSSLADSKTNKEDNFFKKMDVSELPKVNRYIQFTKQHSKALKTFRVTDDVVKKTDLRGLELSRVDVKPLLTEDSFFAHIGTNLNSPPRVNRYIQFTQSEPYSSQQSQSPTVKMTEKERKTSSSSVDNDDALFDGIFESLNKIPKVKKSLLFTQSTYQKSNLTEVPQKVTPQLVTKTESVRSGSLPDNKEVLSKKQDNFFGQVGVSLYEVPKVKKYITFSQSKDYPPIVTPVLVTKTECNSIDSSFEEKQKTVMKEDAFSGQTGMPFDGVPKVKRYIQFTQTEPQPSAQSLLTKLQTRGSEDKVTPTINGDDFFGQTGSSFDELPRVKRHIRFTRAEPRLQPSMLHSLSNRTEKSIQTSTELKMKDLASEDYVAPAAGEHNFFGPIGTFYEIPKLKRYTRFSQSSTQPSSQHLNRQTDRPVLTKPELRTSLADSESNDEDTLFKKKDVSELPKVNRYVQFTQQPSTPRKSLNTHGVTDEKTELWGSDLSRVEITPPVTEDSFLGHLRTNLNSLPRVNRYIQFTQSEPHPSCQSQSSTEKMAKNAPIFTQSEYKNKTAANDKSSNTADTVFGSLDLSFIQLPKEKRHVYNMQSEPHRSSDGGFKLTTKKNEYFGQTDGVPRLIRYRQFRQSESLTQTSSPSISSQKWKTMDGESTDSKMFKTNLTSGTARDLSQIQDAPSGMKVRTETGRLHQLPEPKRSLYSSTPDVYEQPDHVSIEEEEEEEDEEVFRHTSSNSLPGDTKYVNTPGSSDRTASSTTESRTILESKLSSLHASSNESAGLPTRKLVIDPALQDVRQSIPDEPGASPGKDEAREYLRDSSLARQRQERRRLLFRQKRRAMDGFSLSSESFNSQESD
ncbi:hypothetical protein Q7C36_003015 [Tachysurus vachellii]|uniref:Ig-like domain-containing protein n=1 Tax=Tachysurus vachellii TaxID=175792 RepID=A0AA88NSQ3_TACVA|nr:hypothetical protein Q7C36_003015 [Tachysurus vachellii]